MAFHFFKRTGDHGTLVEVCWKSDGNKQGSSYETILKADENGELRLTAYTSEFYYEPYSVNVYRADDDALEQLSSIIDRYNITAWSKLPMDRENVQLDGLSTSVAMIFEKEKNGSNKREYATVYYESKLPDGALDALKEVTDCMEQWAVPERLLDAHYETRRGGEINGELPDDEHVKDAFARLLKERAFGSQIDSGVSFAFRGEEVIEDNACHVFSLEKGEAWAIGTENDAVYRRASGESVWQSV